MSFLDNMNKFKGTKGPWFIDRNGVDARWNIDDAEGNSVALTSQLPNDKDWSKRDANTKLIATAPELLEALEAALEWIDAVPQDTPLPTMPGFSRDWIEDLIERAKGKVSDRELPHPQIDNDGWIAWKGGDSPVNSKVSVEFQQRDGEKDIALAEMLDWICENRSDDIIAYRVIENDGREG